MENPFISCGSSQLKKQQSTLIKSKKQQFRFEIRNIQIKDVKAKMRKLINFKSQQNYNELKNINLIQDLKIVLQVYSQQVKQESNMQSLKYQFVEFTLSAQLQKAIDNIFMYSISSQIDHLCSLMLICHLQKLIFIMDSAYLKKQQSNYFKIFNQTLWILSNYTSYDPRQMPAKFINYLYHLLSQQRHSKQIIQLCLNSFINLSQVQYVKQYLISTHLKDNQNNQKDSIIDRVLKIMSMIIHQIQDKKQQNQYSTKAIVLHLLLQKILQFYAKLLEFVPLQLFSQQYKQYFFKKIQFVLAHHSNELHTIEKLMKVLTTLCVKNIQTLPFVIVQTQNIIRQLSKFLQSNCKLFKKNVKQNNLLPSVINQGIFCIFYVYTPFQYKEQEQYVRQQVLQILDSILSQNLLSALYYGLLCPKQHLNNWCLKTLIQICGEYQFTDLIMDDLRILNQIFHHSYHSSFSLKKSATICLCRLAQTLFIDKSAKHNDQLDQQYQILTNNRLIQIMVTNLDQFVDINLNLQILEGVEVLCEYWSQCLQNKFWNKFQEQGGKLKLQKSLQQKADIIIKKYGNMEIEL